MKKYTKVRLNEALKDIKANFTEVVDYIVYYDSIDEDLKGFDLIYKIEELDIKTEIRLLLNDFNKRDLSKSKTLLYNSLFYGIVNDEESKQELINHLKENKSIVFENYLLTLDKNKGTDGELNIKYVLSQLNEHSSNKNKP
jgi:hypothetical protein